MENLDVIGQKPGHPHIHDPDELAFNMIRAARQLRQTVIATSIFGLCLFIII